MRPLPARQGRDRLTIAEITQRNVQLIAKLEQSANQSRTWGEYFADFAAALIGSWTFLIAQSLMIAFWIALNVWAWLSHWDPYPFILLNLLMSFQAAFATPLILMSQNRQAKLADRRNELDLQINLLAEQESTEQLRLMRLICQRLQIDAENPDLQALEESTQPDKIVQQIVSTMDSQRENRNSETSEKGAE